MTEISNPTTQIKNTKHPKGLFVLGTSELWERFNFYGSRTLFTLFLVNCLSFTDAGASKLYGAFLGLSYLASLLGGYLADNVMGNKKCLIFGGLTTAIGQFLLFFAASIFHNHFIYAKVVMWIGLGFIIVGTGLFKPNVSSMVGALYKPKDKKLDSAYTIFYMMINFGAFIGINICALLGDVKDVNGIRDLSAFKWGFLTSTIAMLIGVATYFLLNKKYVLDPNNGAVLGIQPNKFNDTNTIVTKQKINIKEIIKNLISISVLVVIFYFILRHGRSFDFPALVYGLIYSIGIVLILKIYLDKSLTHEERNRLNIIIICSFFVIFFWAGYEQAASSLTFIADKYTDNHIFGFNMPASMVQNATSFFVISLSPFFGWLWLFLQKKKLDPSSYTKQAFGLLFLGIGYLIIALKVKGLTIETKISVLWLFLLYFFHVVGELCLSPIGLALVFKLAPKRLVSLMMGIWFIATAAGNTLSGTLGALLPPSHDKFIKAKNLNINLQDILDKKIIPSDNTLNILENNNLPSEYPNIIGFDIHNIYEFFMCFVVLSVGVSIILFTISKWLSKMEKTTN